MNNKIWVTLLISLLLTVGVRAEDDIFDYPAGQAMLIGSTITAANNCGVEVIDMQVYMTAEYASGLRFLEVVDVLNDPLNKSMIRTIYSIYSEFPCKEILQNYKDIVILDEAYAPELIGWSLEDRVLHEGALGSYAQGCSEDITDRDIFLRIQEGTGVSEGDVMLVMYRFSKVAYGYIDDIRERMSCTEAINTFKGL